MGIRLNIDTVNNGITKNVFYGTKLFGYGDTEALKSYKFLYKLHLIDEVSYCFAWINHEPITLNSDTFKEFIRLYRADMVKRNWWEEEDFKEFDKDIDEIIKNNTDGLFLISWE